jgi:hypothetical protein
LYSDGESRPFRGLNPGEVDPEEETEDVDETERLVLRNPLFMMEKQEMQSVFYSGIRCS